MKIVLASRNEHKCREIQTLLADLGIEILSLNDFPDMPEVEEDKDTFAGNAEKKALETAEYTGLLALADDSGLCIDFLGGAPGVYSARFAGEPCDDDANNQKVFKLMEGVPPDQRTAHFACTMSLAIPEKILHTVEGKVEGVIIDELRGENGFGYDPLFFYPPYNATLAEVSPEKKNAVSHRANAAQKMKEFLQKYQR